MEAPRKSGLVDSGRRRAAPGSFDQEDEGKRQGEEDAGEDEHVVRRHSVGLLGDLPVQDLAGNIDPQAPFALNNGTLDTFLKERNVNYLLIPDLATRQDKLYQYLHTHLKLELVKDAPKSPTQNLYRVQW